jgi:hypothetical protein
MREYTPEETAFMDSLCGQQDENSRLLEHAIGQLRDTLKPVSETIIALSWIEPDELKSQATELIGTLVEQVHDPIEEAVEALERMHKADIAG